MAKLIWAVLCRSAVIDKYTNLASIHDAVDSLFATQEPELESQISIDLNVITNWGRSDFETPELPFRCRCLIVYPDGSRGKGAALEVNLTTSGRVRNVFRFAGIEYKGWGEYGFAVERSLSENDSENDWTEVYRIPLQVRLQVKD